MHVWCMHVCMMTCGVCKYSTCMREVRIVRVCLHGVWRIYMCVCAGMYSEYRYGVCMCEWHEKSRCDVSIARS